jgi:predicted ATPase/DNA-binding CsgD family transcriptional regulator
MSFPGCHRDRSGAAEVLYSPHIVRAVINVPAWARGPWRGGMSFQGAAFPLIYSEQSPDRTSHAPNLPLPLSRFIGREREIATLTRLQDRTSLLTLTGPGGSGKTRLALRVAAERAQHSAHRVCWVELAALTDAALVPQAVATAAGLYEAERLPLPGALAAAFAGPSLLILDNCEHLIAACALLAESLLRACPTLHILATSRERLRVSGEVVWRVRPLTVPDAAPTVASLAESEAVQLFVERARGRLPNFALTEENAAAVATICQRLDGMPLALELAAARVAVLPVGQLAARLDDALRVLTGGERTAPPRQQALRATLDWSHTLLTAEERAMLRRLAVFAAGWELEAAEAVCGAEEIAGADALELLGQLVEKSLVAMAEEGGTARYSMLEVVRQYASERLTASGEAEDARRRHAMYYLAMVAEPASASVGAAQMAWVERLEREHDNLRAALHWAVEQEEAETALRLVGALWPFWEARGYLREGRQWLTAALGMADGGDPALRGKALRGAGLLATWQGDYPAARALHAESLTLYRSLGDRDSIAHALENLGMVAHEQGDYAAAAALHAESLGIRRELGDRRNIASSLNNLGLVKRGQGEYAAARALHEESLAIHRALRDQQGVGNELSNLGIMAYLQGDDAAARALHEESLALRRTLGDRRGIAISLNNLGLVAYRQGEYATARTLHQESLAIRRALGDASIPESLEGLAAVAGAMGAASRAARLLGAASAWRTLHAAPLTPDERADQEGWIARARAGSALDVWDVAWAAGAAMPIEEIIAEALVTPSPMLSHHTDGPAQPNLAPAIYPDGLTAREVDVLREVAAGKSNKEIAESLSISGRTVDRHIANLYMKIDAHNKADAAAYAFRNGLMR